MADAIAEMFRLLSPLSVDREIHGKTATFYTCSVRTCARLQNLLSKMAGYLSTLMGADSKRDQGKVEEDYQTESGEVIQKTRVEPINPDLARLRTQQKQAAVEGAVQELLSDSNRTAIGELLMDSLKDNFPRGKKRPAEECLEFVDSMDLPTLILFLQGLAMANAKVFGDLGKGLGRAVQTQAEKLLGKVRDEDANEDPPTDG